MSFLDAVKNEIKNKDVTTTKRAAESMILQIHDREPIHFNNQNGRIRKMYWPEIGLVGFHDLKLKQDILKNMAVGGPNIEKLKNQIDEIKSMLLSNGLNNKTELKQLINEQNEKIDSINKQISLIEKYEKKLQELQKNLKKEETLLLSLKTNFEISKNENIERKKNDIKKTMDVLNRFDEITMDSDIQPTKTTTNPIINKQKSTISEPKKEIYSLSTLGIDSTKIESPDVYMSSAFTVFDSII
jgi:predicted nuclease with TOPRIM domain